MWYTMNITMNNGFFDINLGLLRNRFPDIAKKLGKIKYSHINKNKEIIVEEDKSSSGLKTLIVRKNSAVIPIHSKIDPLKEVENLIKRKIDGNEDAVFIVGFGLGYHIERVIEILPDVELYLFEPSTEIFIKALETRNFDKILKHEKLHIFIDLDRIDDTLFQSQIPNTSKMLILKSYQRLFNHYVNNLTKSYNDFINRNSINIATLKRFDKLWTKNSFKNVVYFFARAGVNLIENRAKGIGCIVVGAGPSVEGDLDILNQFSKRGYIIIAVDTALRPLLMKSVIPDFVVSVDPQYINSLFLQITELAGIQTSKIPILVADPAIYPASLKNYPGRVIVSSSVFPPGRVIESFSGNKGYLAAGGSVSVAAFDFARLLGCNPILITGLDLSFKHDRTHLRGSLIDLYRINRSTRLNPILNSVAEYMTSGAPFKMFNSKNKPCYSDKRMLLYKSWFEKNIPGTSADVINSTGEGLLLDNVTHKTMKEMLEDNSLSSNKTFRTNKERAIASIIQVIDEYRTNKDGIEEFIKYLINVEQNLKIMKSEAEKAFKYINRYINKEPGQTPIEDINRRLNIHDAKIVSLKQEIRLISMTMQSVVFDILIGTTVDEKKSDKKSIESSLKNSLKLYRSIIEGCNYLINIINFAKLKLKNVCRFSDNKDECR